MRRLRAAFRRMLGLFRRGNDETSMAEEMQAHLDGLIARNLATDMTIDEARRAARRTFGGLAQIEERCRDQRRARRVEHVLHDFRHAFRLLAKNPLLSTVIIVSLGFGVGANTTIFSWIRTVLFRPVPGVADGASFLALESRSDANAFPGWSWLEYRDLRERLPAFHELIAFEMTPLNIGETGRDERVYSQLVSENFFSGLGLRPLSGRFFHRDEVSQPGGAPVVVLSHGFWQSHFGGADVVGHTLRANNRILTIIGVAPPDFHGSQLGLNFDVWVPATLAPVLLDGSRELEQRTARGYRVMGRLRPEAGIIRAQSELDAAMRDFARDYPETNATLRGEIRTSTHPARGPQRMLINGLVALQGVALLVLVVVCANTANLLLARATARRREIGVRLAIGAAPGRIASMLLAESLVLAAFGGGLGIALASWGTDALRALPVYGGLPLRFDTALDGSALGFAAALALGSGVIFGVAPAWQLARTDPQAALRSGAQSAGRSSLRSVLVGIEAGIAVIVLVVAAFFFRNLVETRSTDPGFTRDGVLLAAYDLSGRGYDFEAAKTVTRTLLERLREIPEVEAAAIASAIPLDIHGLGSRRFKVEGDARPADRGDEALSYNITPGYFRVMGIALVAGNDFADLADAAQPPQAIVNAEFARRCLDGSDAIGRRVESGGRTYEIVGVARDSLYESFGEPAKPVLYFSYRDRPGMYGQIHLRTRGRESALAARVREIVRGINPAVQVFDVRTMNEHVDRNLLFRRVPARMFAVLGPLILLLAAIGIYAVAAYAVAQRTLEIGVRRALGATEAGVIFQIVREGMRSVISGAAIGWLVVFAINLHLRRGVAVGPGILFGVPTVLLIIAAFACWLPARRAARVDPVVALREQ